MPRDDERQPHSADEPEGKDASEDAPRPGASFDDPWASEHNRTDATNQRSSSLNDEADAEWASDPDANPAGDAEASPARPEQPPGPKPFISRAINKIGIPTGPGVDWALDWLQVLAIAGLLAWGVMSYGIVRMRVPTGSMEPTIMPGDSFFVDKFSYLLGLNHPESGDVVVFWHTDNARMCRANQFLYWSWGELEPCQERFVKRLIAIGPAEVAIRRGDVYVDGSQMNGPAFDRDYVCRAGAPREPTARDAEGCSWDVPEGKMFVLGDNTRNSSDSRYWGFAETSTLIGEPFFRVWPLERIGPMNGYFGSGR